MFPIFEKYGLEEINDEDRSGRPILEKYKKSPDRILLTNGATFFRDCLPLSHKKLPD